MIFFISVPKVEINWFIDTKINIVKIWHLNAKIYSIR